jgi:hypothetical protein
MGVFGRLNERVITFSPDQRWAIVEREQLGGVYHYHNLYHDHEPGKSWALPRFSCTEQGLCEECDEQAPEEIFTAYKLLIMQQQPPDTLYNTSPSCFYMSPSTPLPTSGYIQKI